MLAERDPDRAIFFELLSSWYEKRFGNTIAAIEEHAGVRKGDRKLVSKGDETALFDLASDPTEQVDLAARRPDEVRALSELLATQRARAEQDAAGFEPGGDAVLDERATDQLCALGYIRC